MRTFNVLPTDPRFTELTDEQVEFIAIMHKEDIKQQKNAMKKSSSDDDIEELEIEDDPDFDEYWDSHSPDTEEVSDWEEV